MNEIISNCGFALFEVKWVNYTRQNDGGVQILEDRAIPTGYKGIYLSTKHCVKTLEKSVRKWEEKEPLL